jgi:aspartyl-tRNA(Asn)/glutamyl-tRNA(Gln) amidotransferase subunit C
LSLDHTTVSKIAHLARIAITAPEAEQMSVALGRILELVDRMQQVDTTGVAPMAHPLHMTQPLRADQVTETDLREVAQAIAPAAESGLYLVPRVVE